MKKRIDNRGFTLVELLAVLVILIAIMGIAIPSISSSLERSKEKQNESRKKVLVSAAEVYVTDHKNQIYNNIGSNSTCSITLDELQEYLPDGATKDSDDKDLTGCIQFTKPNTYKYSSSCSTLCLDN